MKKFTESLINTKLGKFNFRVYAENRGKETVVVYTEKINTIEPVLVRVHSECMTGDVFHSLQCDCGDQLDTALQEIQKNGNGVVIYLRQEGRGIGLYEKIRAYGLQAKGYDTFEANVLLGHNPDERTYEMVKTALDDLGIKQIILLTNNPSKVSEIAKTGIRIIERKSLIVGRNEVNDKYFETKKAKFKHFFNDEVSYYFYQFHADRPQIVEEIGEFLKDKKKDPLLKICIGVQFDTHDFENFEKIETTKRIFDLCEFYEGFVPILHFSYKYSVDQLGDTKKIREKLPFVTYLQTNDFETTSNDLNFIKYVTENFLADIPLDNENFGLIQSEEFRNLIKNNKAFLLLDNSKGTGIQESKDILMKKIDSLLKYHLNDIAIFGGFGPDDLNSYFELRRYYKINFSIDAETKLKTNGEIDTEKIKTYLTQLIRFDDPVQAGIEQTRTFQYQNKKEDWVTSEILGSTYAIHPAVFNPTYFPSTTWYAEIVNGLVKDKKNFCEVGCGSGIISCYLAKQNTDLNVYATDINPFAAENTIYNANLIGVQERVKAANGDVLDGIPKDEKFDVIFWAMPFGFMDPGTNISMEDAQFFDAGYRAIRKFLKDGKNYLNKDGELLIGFSTDLGNYDLLKEICNQYKIELKKVAETEMQEKEVLKFEVFQGKYI
jgi:GTP cyclohydrolase II